MDTFTLLLVGAAVGFIAGLIVAVLARRMTRSPKSRHRPNPEQLADQTATDDVLETDLEEESKEAGHQRNAIDAHYRDQILALEKSYQEQLADLEATLAELTAGLFGVGSAGNSPVEPQRAKSEAEPPPPNSNVDQEGGESKRLFMLASRVEQELLASNDGEELVILPSEELRALGEKVRHYQEEVETDLEVTLNRKQDDPPSESAVVNSSQARASELDDVMSQVDLAEIARVEEPAWMSEVDSELDELIDEALSDSDPKQQPSNPVPNVTGSTSLKVENAHASLDDAVIHISRRDDGAANQVERLHGVFASFGHSTEKPCWGDDAGPWNASYFQNRNLEGPPAAQRPESILLLEDVSSLPEPMAHGAEFSASWERIVALEPGSYHFIITCIDGVRFWLGKRLIISAWFDHEQLTLSRAVRHSGGPVEMKLHYYSSGTPPLIRITCLRLS